MYTSLQSSPSSSAAAHAASHPPSSAAPVLQRNGVHAECTSFVTHNAPQCCHCGWRGDHAPNCPFK